MRAMLEKRVDQLIADKTFDLRRETLESMTDDYLIQQAADHDKLSVPEYLKKEISGKDGVTDAEAKTFYDKNKGQGAAPFVSIKPQIARDDEPPGAARPLEKERAGKDSARAQTHGG